MIYSCMVLREEHMWVVTWDTAVSIIYEYGKLDTFVAMHDLRVCLVWVGQGLQVIRCVWWYNGV